MRQIAPLPFRLLISTVILATGVTIYAVFAGPFRLLPAAFLTAIGLFRVAKTVSTFSTDRLRTTSKRWWFGTILAFLPYGFVTAPTTSQAESLGSAIAGTVSVTALEIVAGTMILSAVTITAVYGSARYGVYPGRPSPEDRVLDNSNAD